MFEFPTPYGAIASLLRKQLAPRKHSRGIGYLVRCGCCSCTPLILKVLKEDYPTPQELARYRTEYEILHQS